MGWTGVEQLRAILSGDTPAPPISRLTGLRLTEFGSGTATFTLPLSRWLAGPNGAVSLGVLNGSSLYMTVSSGSGRAPVQNPPAEQPPAVEPWARELDGESPDPWERALDGEVSAPIELLTGLAPVAAADGQASYTLPASPWFCAPPPGRVQGGMVAMLAEAAMERAAATQAPPDTTYAPVDLKVNYLRPLASDGAVARADARTLRTGRRLAVVSAEVRDAADRPVAVATGSGLFAARAR